MKNVVAHQIHGEERLALGVQGFEDHLRVVVLPQADHHQLQPLEYRVQQCFEPFGVYGGVVPGSRGAVDFSLVIDNRILIAWPVEHELLDPLVEEDVGAKRRKWSVLRHAGAPEQMRVFLGNLTVGQLDEVMEKVSV